MKVRTVFYLTIATLLLTSAVEARGLFGNLGRAIRDSVRGVGKSVRDTASGLKSDVEQGTGIPIAEIEMRKRRKSVKRYIIKLHNRVTNKGEMDAAVVYLWNSLGQLEEGDDETLRKLIEYFEGTIRALKKPDVPQKKFDGYIQRLERYLMNLNDHRAELAEDYDLVTDFRLKPTEGEGGGEEGGDGGGEEGSGEESYDEGGGGEEGGEQDPVMAEFDQLTAKYKDRLKGNGYLKVTSTGDGQGATFSVVDPETGNVLAENANTNKNHRIRAGIFHLVISVADATLYRFNVVILPRKIAQVKFRTFGKLYLADEVEDSCIVYESKTGRPAYEGLSGGGDITLPTGTYTVANENGDKETEVVVEKGKTKTVAF